MSGIVGKKVRLDDGSCGVVLAVQGVEWSERDGDCIDTVYTFFGLVRLSSGKLAALRLDGREVLG